MNTETQNEQLVLREPIDNTPFIKVTIDKQTFLTVGRYRVSPMFENPDDAEKYLDTNMWELIFTLINCVQDATTHANQQPQQSPE